jgi:hypothetical protein
MWRLLAVHLGVISVSQRRFAGLRWEDIVWLAFLNERASISSVAEA